MPERAVEIANLLLREGALRKDEPLHKVVLADLIGDADLFADVGHRLAAVGYELVERLGHVGVRLAPDATVEDRVRNRMGLHAGHVRLIVYLWTELVYREWANLRREVDTAPGGREQRVLFEDEEDAPWIPLSRVHVDFGETTSRTYVKSLLTKLRETRFIRMDEKRDMVWADASLYTLLDQNRLEDFVVELARRLGTSTPEEAVTQVVRGSRLVREKEEGA